MCIVQHTFRQDGVVQREVHTEVHLIGAIATPRGAGVVAAVRLLPGRLLGSHMRSRGGIGDISMGYLTSEAAVGELKGLKGHRKATKQKDRSESHVTGDSSAKF